MLYFSSTGGTNNGGSHVSTVAFASGSNYLANLDGTGVSGGTVGTEGVRVSDDGFVYASNLSGSPASNFKIYRWNSDTDTTTPPTVVYDSGPGTSFQWRVGDYMDLRGSGINTEIVAVGNGSGANITTTSLSFGRPMRPAPCSPTSPSPFQAVRQPSISAARAWLLKAPTMPSGSAARDRRKPAVSFMIRPTLPPS
ncbi:MAG: hypothetical protein WDN00_17190 [Limisphaerales bacterium]